MDKHQNPENANNQNGNGNNGNNGYIININVENYYANAPLVTNPQTTVTNPQPEAEKEKKGLLEKIGTFLKGIAAVVIGLYNFFSGH